VFSVDEVAMMFPKLSSKTLSKRLGYYAKTGGLLRLRKGIYAKKEFNEWELANKLYNPSYISLTTVLLKNGLIFQYDSTISVVSYLNREVEVAGVKIKYRKIKDTVALDTTGITKEDGTWVASSERAFLDSVYLFGSWHIDNLSILDWNKVFKILPIYKNKELEKRVESYLKDYKREYYE